MANERGTGAGSPDTLPASAPSFTEALKVWLQIGLTSFGGPAGRSR